MDDYLLFASFAYGLLLWVIFYCLRGFVRVEWVGLLLLRLGLPDCLPVGCDLVVLMMALMWWFIEDDCALDWVERWVWFAV